MSAKPWYPKVALAIASRDDEWWKWYASFVDYDPKPALAKMTMPIFVAIGENDALFDRDAMTRAWSAIAAQAGHDVRVRVYPGVGHALRAGSGTDQPAAYWTDLAAWLAEKRLR
jgi:acetyl esterase/lipase